METSKLKFLRASRLPNPINGILGLRSSRTDTVNAQTRTRSGDQAGGRGDEPPIPPLTHSQSSHPTYGFQPYATLRTRSDSSVGTVVVDDQDVGEETAEDRIIRIKARVAESRSYVDTASAGDGSAKEPTPSMFQPRQRAAGGTITASRPSLHHEICNVNSVDSKHASETLPGHGKSSSVDSPSNTVRKSSQSNQRPSRRRHEGLSRPAGRVLSYINLKLDVDRFGE